MKQFLLLFTTLLFSAASFAQINITGKITDEKNAAVPFATVYVKNTTIGTSANSEGEYTLALKAGHYEMVFRAVGYKQESKQVDVKANQTLNVKLLPESYLLKDVTISAKGEDPAYAIMRKAIKKRKFYLNEVDAYSCEVYIKGLQRMLEAPKKFMGRDINQVARQIGLDSNRRGILYLSESESKYSFERPNNVHEEMISSKVSGRNQAFSFNRASDMKVNFYENLQQWGEISNRPLVSPLADDAMLYYKYKLLGESVENGETVYKISLGPRRAYDPCFEGVIYILKDNWRLYGIDLMITKKKANINFVDTLKINQQFIPVSNNVWMTSSARFDFVGGLFGFRVGGYFISIYKDYNLQPNTPKKDFKEVLRITRDVNKKDSLYWAEERPVPLTEEERNDYIKKEALARHRESKQYLDSLDRRNNKFHLGSLLLGGGYNVRNRYEKEYFHYDSFLGSMLFNTVEGVAFNYGASYTKQIDSVTNRYLRVAAHVRYGFSDKLFNANANATIPFNGVTLNVSGGSDVVDLNNRGTVTTLENTVYSLAGRENFEKLYQKDYVNVNLSGRISGGWLGSAGVEWANRKWLPNSSSWSVFNQSRQYTSNNPLIPNADVPLFPENQSFKLNFRTSYNFSDKYETYPRGRRYLPSDYPTIGLNYTKGVNGFLGSDVNYDLVSADITKSDISLGMYGQSSFYISAGKFLNAKSLYFPDYKQFSGNQLFFYQPNITHFLLLDYYRFSTYTEYLEGHFEHNFSGFILNKIPLIRKLKLKEIVDVNYLTTPGLKNYAELGIGLEYFGFRMMYGQSYNSGSNVHQALRLSIGF